MIKSLRKARIVDGLPRIVAGQKWVQAFSDALGPLHEKTIDFADGSQIYTALDSVSEAVLDTLAVNWKIDWYDPSYPVEKKRRIVKTALIVRRLMGTAYAVKLQADAVYPGSKVEEWFEYDGEPGCFRLYVDITDSTPGNPATIMSPIEMERRLVTSKRWSSHLESFAYQITHALLMGSDVTVWVYRTPVCGILYCGTYWEDSTLGWSENDTLLEEFQTDGFPAYPDFTGTLPQASRMGYSVCGKTLSGGASVGYAVSSNPAGSPFCGTLPDES